MGFGFECSDGWYKLINNLCKNIYDYFKGNIPEHFYVIQVKEKFGALRFYITSAPAEIHDMIHETEKESYFICERCGKHGKEFYRDMLPWIQTLCDDCLRKHLDKMGLPFESFISDWQKKNKAPFKEMK